MTTTSPGLRTARCASATVTSFPPQRFDRRQPDSAPRRIRGTDQRDAERERETPCEDTGGEVRCDEAGRARVIAERVRGEHAEAEADAERDERDRERLADDQRADAPGAPA